jgi:hypothetical protein
MSGRIEEAEYATAQAQLLALLPIVRTMPLRPMIEAMNRAESLGAIIDPTLFLQAGPNLRALKLLASALLPFQAEIDRLVRANQLQLEEEIPT